MRSLVRLAGEGLLFALLFGGAPFAAARTVPQQDNQWWQELDLAGSVGDRWSYLISGFSRFSDNDPNPALTGCGAFVTYTQGAFGYSVGYLRAQVRLPSTGNPLEKMREKGVSSLRKRCDG